MKSGLDNSFFLALISILFGTVVGYYSHYKSFGSGDTIITASYMGGGFVDDYHRWLIECNDGEGMIGIYDTSKQFTGISQVWCYFLFPKKPPSAGIYPFYPSCHVRNFSLHEYYCYEKLWPVDTSDTFVTGLYSPTIYDPVNPNLMKCCKTPPGYRLDYTRCQWKYTHDKAGEHYDGYWVTKCDTNFVMTGMGMGMNPWENQLHYTFIQCCPVIHDGRVVDMSRQLL
ncbi:uncharacterized protein LOC129591130 [Paramacrobiotus metropolitanus]|uniref:uncharacterized protein LOC129591130 n=1 Tax=Paramacrobiotus metropolitanus TaxID=2943436 RepID=UPI002445DA1B|nr:uncharacterized protein LOC129591130 [Paramacrobiotus metropolitanus]